MKVLLIICKFISFASLCIITIFLTSCSSLTVSKNDPIAHDQILKLKSDSIVTQINGKPILMGGLSFLNFNGEDSSGCYKFISGTDRGPNGENFNSYTFKNGKTYKTEGRIFFKPQFAPRLLFLKACKKNLNLKKEKEKEKEIDLDLDLENFFEIENEILLSSSEGPALSGLPPRDGIKDEVPFGADGERLSRNINGIDPESMAIDSQGHYWIGEEYLPSLIEFDKTGKMIGRISPKESFSPEEALNSRIELSLPQELNHRALNRGFEGIAIKGSDLYFMTQSPLVYENQKKNESRIVRIYIYNVDSKKLSGEFLYEMDSEFNKIGDLAFSPDGILHLIEQNGKEGAEGFRKIFALNFSNSSNILFDKSLKPFELMSAIELKKTQVQYLAKREVLDLKKVAFNFEKIEGLTFIDKNQISVINDNDFGIANQFGNLPSESFLGIFKINP